MTTPTDGESDADWMSAVEAIALLPSRRAICRHARARLVKARAKLFIAYDGRRFSDCDIPSDFWWAEGDEALEQDWTTGHFRTSAFGRAFGREEAFGVRFRRSDILQLKPASARAAGSLTSNAMPGSLEPTPATALTSIGSLEPSPSPAQRTVFIGHGHSSEWLKLEKFLRERLHLNVVEFNSSSPLGVATTKRLNEMLEAADFAFLVLTGEDEQTTGKLNPRLNVVHEAGLFQGKLGFEKAIILREEGCEDFSNVHGLGEGRFPKGKITAEFEEVRRVLEREGVIGARVESGN